MTIEPGIHVTLGTDPNIEDDENPMLGRTGEVISISGYSHAGYNCIIVLHMEPEELAEHLGMDLEDVMLNFSAEAYGIEDPDPFGPYVYFEADTMTLKRCPCEHLEPFGDHGTWVEEWRCKECGRRAD